jgi:hypothetical protein
MLSRGIAPSGDPALIRVATLGLEKELDALSSAELTD